MMIDIPSLFLGLSFGLILIGLWGFWLSHFKVEEGHLAILTRFGSVVRTTRNNNFNGLKKESNETHLDFIENLPIKIFKPGAHWKCPWDKVILFSTMERVIDLSGEKGGKYAMAADGTVLRLDSKIRFYPKINDIYSYLFELKNPMGHIREMFTCIIRNEIANFQVNVEKQQEDILGSYALIRRERKNLNEQVEVNCRDYFGDTYGIQFCGVDLIDIIPPHELESALNGIQNARTEANILYSKAEADARQKIIAAEQGVEIAKTRAESVTRELNILARMIKKLTNDGEIDNYFTHRKMELVGDSKMLFMQKGELKW